MPHSSERASGSTKAAINCIASFRAGVIERSSSAEGAKKESVAGLAVLPAAKMVRCP